MHNAWLLSHYSPLCSQPWLYFWWTLYQTKSLHFLNPATITFVNFVDASAHISTLKQTAPLPPPLSILNSITVTLCISLPNYQLNRLQQIQNSLARAVVKAPFSHITPILKSLYYLKYNERIEYKLLSLTYKVSTHLLIHSSAHICHHHHWHHPSLLHFFYSRFKTYLFNKSFLP